jgi:hypothetical protein
VSTIVDIEPPLTPIKRTRKPDAEPVGDHAGFARQIVSQPPSVAAEQQARRDDRRQHDESDLENRLRRECREH